MLNVVALMGRLVADPELKQTPNGNAVTTFTVAVDRTYTPKGQEKQADFITVVCWRQTAEFVAKYFLKGSLIAVNGSIQTRKYEDKNGNKRTAFEVVAENVHFAGAKTEQKPEQKAEPKSEPCRYSDFPTIGEEDGEDLPF